MMQVPHTLLVTVEPGSDEQRVAVVLSLSQQTEDARVRRRVAYLKVSTS